jgi:hypothetical protein
MYGLRRMLDLWDGWQAGIGCDGTGWDEMGWNDGVLYLL